MAFPALQAKLKSGDQAARKDCWKIVTREHLHHLFSPAEARSLQTLLLKEEDLDVRTTGMLCLDKTLDLTGPAIQESFHSWLFHSFRHAQIDSVAAAKRSLVATVCDNEYIRSAAMGSMIRSTSVAKFAAS